MRGERGRVGFAEGIGEVRIERKNAKMSLDEKDSVASQTPVAFLADCGVLAHGDLFDCLAPADFRVATFGVDVKGYFLFPPCELPRVRDPGLAPPHPARRKANAPHHCHHYYQSIHSF